MRLFTRGAQKRLAFATDVEYLKSQTGFLDDELYAAHLEIARLRARIEELSANGDKLRTEIAELLPWAAFGLGAHGECTCVNPAGDACDTDGSPEAQEAHRLVVRVLAGDYGEVK